MPRLTDIAMTPPASPGGGDDFFKQANTVINNFKQGIKMLQEVQGMAKGQAPTDNNPQAIPQRQPATKEVIVQRVEVPVPGPGWNIAGFLGGLIEKGYGDVPINLIIKQLGTLTLKEILQKVQDAKQP